MDNKILDRYRQMMGVSHGYTYEYFDYLEHTGRGEYIVLPYQPNNRTRLNLKYSVPTITEECILFGSRNRNRTIVFYWYQNTNSGGSIFSRTGGGQVNFGNSFVYDWYEVVANTSMEWVKKRPGTSTSDQTRTWDTTEFTVPFNLYLFAINHNDGVIGTGSHDSKVNKIAGVKMSAIELYENETLLMYLRPARRSDGRTGYHDTLNDVFYFSENEYDFNVGNYADEYIYYDYIESTGTQWIDTKYVLGAATVGASFNLKDYDSSATSATGILGLSNGRTNVDRVTVAYTLGRLVMGFYAPTNRQFSFSMPGGATVEYEANATSTNVTLNGVYITWGGTSLTYTGTLNILTHRNGQPFNIFHVQLKHIWVRDGDIFNLDMVPSVRRWDGKVGMFEKVNNILYQSYTSTPFTVYGNFS